MNFPGLRPRDPDALINAYRGKRFTRAQRIALHVQKRLLEESVNLKFRNQLSQNLPNSRKVAAWVAKRKRERAAYDAIHKKYRHPVPIHLHPTQNLYRERRSPGRSKHPLFPEDFSHISSDSMAEPNDGRATIIEPQPSRPPDTHQQLPSIRGRLPRLPRRLPKPPHRGSSGPAGWSESSTKGGATLDVGNDATATSLGLTTTKEDPAPPPPSRSQEIRADSTNTIIDEQIISSPGVSLPYPVEQLPPIRGRQQLPHRVSWDTISRFSDLSKEWSWRGDFGSLVEYLEWISTISSSQTQTSVHSF